MMLAQIPILSKGWYFFMGKYKKFSETRAETIILDEWVEMTWTANNKKYYESKGYKYTKQYDKFLCHVDDISSGSGARISVQCGVCGGERVVEFKHLAKYGQTLCNGCSHTFDLLGISFGRWTVIEFCGTKNGSVYWLCECECGVVREVQSGALVNGSSKSCGCYSAELTRKRHGENSPTWKGGEIEVVCEFCGKEYSVKKSWVEKTRFCSRGCLGEWMSENASGTNSVHWNFDLTLEERIIKRNYPEYREWIKAVLEKDNYTCQVCGYTGNELETHHMYSYRHYPEYSLSVEHGITMCKTDHANFHSWMGGNKIPCTPSDIDRWLYTIS